MSRPRHSARSISPKIVAKQHLCNMQQMLQFEQYVVLTHPQRRITVVMLISPSASNQPVRVKGTPTSSCKIHTQTKKKPKEKVSQIFHHLFPRLAQTHNDLDSLLKRATSFPPLYLGDPSLASEYKIGLFDLV
jgi:hypothetical protein